MDEAGQEVVEEEPVVVQAGEEVVEQEPVVVQAGEEVVEQDPVDELDLDLNGVKEDLLVQDLLESGYAQSEVDEVIRQVRLEKEKQMEEVVIDEVVVDRAGMDAGEEVPIRRRGRSQRILKIKLSKIGPDPDGGGGSKEKAWSLD